MCQQRVAWYRPCKRIHIAKYCDDKKHCAVYNEAKAVEKRINARTPRCATCYSVPLYKQVWYSQRHWCRWSLKKMRLSKIQAYIGLVFSWMLADMAKLGSFALQMPKTRRGKWLPKGFWARAGVFVRAAVFLGVIFFIINWVFKYLGFFQTYVPWHRKLFGTVAWPVYAPLDWGWHQLTGGRRGMGEKVLYWIWDHTPVVVKAFCHFLRGVFKYYVSWTWCEMNCSFFAPTGYTRRVRVEGCKWECFNKL